MLRLESALRTSDRSSGGDLKTNLVSVAIVEEHGGHNNTLPLESIPFLQICYASIVSDFTNIIGDKGDKGDKGDTTEKKVLTHP
ncbi:MAG: hypothetical protein Fur006_17810 [Coleofasciculaceae cyanobacterium]